MFFLAKIEIDPSQITIIKKIDQESVWSKLADMLTMGSISDRQEQETFTVISILHQIQMGLMRMKVDNVVKISVDDFDYFTDKESKEHDLQIAMDNLEKNIDSVESERFELINLVLEHKDGNMKYVIDIKIKRKHPVGEYPVVIRINGMMMDFMLRENESLDHLKNRMSHVFSSQEDYDNHLQKNEDYFQTFVREFEHNLSKFIRVDGIKIFVTRKLPRPKLIPQLEQAIAFPKSVEPAFVGYPGIDKYLRYSMLWGNECSDNNITCSDFVLVDEHGNDILTFGKVGFNAGETTILNSGGEFNLPQGITAEAHSGNVYKTELISLNMISVEESTEETKITHFSDYKYEIID